MVAGPPTVLQWRTPGHSGSGSRRLQAGRAPSYDGRVSEQIEYTLAAVDAETRRPLAMQGGFARVPEPGAPAELFARCMQCNRRGSVRADGVDPGDDATKLALAAPDAIVMHPGPLNRGVEISDDVADGPQSVVLDQVEAGVAVRMAVLYAYAQHGSEPEPLPTGE